jgi:uncharacterized protein involved in exopolysaccharide biosynthesis
MNQQPQPTSLYPVERGDELSLIELWKVLVEYKLLIIVLTTITTLSGIYYNSTLKPIYEADVLMLPAFSDNQNKRVNIATSLSNIIGLSRGVGSSIQSEKALARLKTNRFLSNYITKKNLKHILYPKQWDKERKQWVGREPSNNEASKLLKNMIFINTDINNKAGLIVLTLRWVDPDDVGYVEIVANELVEEMNKYARNKTRLESKKGIKFLEKRLIETSVLSMQNIIYSLIENKTNSIMISDIKDEFVFEVIDPAISKRVEDNMPLIIIIMGVIFGIFIGSFLAVSINYFKSSS